MTLIYDELRAMPEEERQIKALTDQDQVYMAKLALRGWQFKYYPRAGASETPMWLTTAPAGISGYGYRKTAHLTLMAAITAARMSEMTREANSAT